MTLDAVFQNFKKTKTYNVFLTEDEIKTLLTAIVLWMQRVENVEGFLKLKKLHEKLAKSLEGD